MEVPVDELRMKEDGRYYSEETGSPFSGIGFHAKNGVRLSQSHFRDGFREGEHSAFWPETGEKRIQGKYVEGFRSGLQTEWSVEGVKTSESTFASGALEGSFKTWFPNTGAIQEEGTYHSGKRHGAWITYYDDPSLEHQEEEERRKSQEANYDNGQLSGMERRWTIRGVLIYEGNYVDGQMEGLHKKWHPNGIQQEANSYKNGQLFGNHEEWYDNGQLKYSTRYLENGANVNEQFWDVEGNELDEYPVPTSSEPLPEDLDQPFLSEEQEFTPGVGAKNSNTP